MNGNKWFISLLISVSIFLPVIVTAQSASFYLSPKSGNYGIGETFAIDVFIKTEGVAINAAQTDIYFSSQILRVTGVSKNNSIFSLWTQEPVYSNSNGRVSFGGGLPNPGFQGSAGRIITIYFQGKSVGKTQVYLSNEAILANDAWGTNVFSSSVGGEYTIGPSEERPEETPPPIQEETGIPAPPRIKSPTHPSQEQWCNNNNPLFQWALSPDIIGVNTAISRFSSINLEDVSQGLFNSKEFKELEDGVWYFYAKLQNGFGWGQASRYKVQIDTEPPLPFEITVDSEGDNTNPQPLLYFKTSDDLSGMSHYEIKIGEGDIFKLIEAKSNPLRLPNQKPGTHHIIVEAVDLAGNKTAANTDIFIESIAEPGITICPKTFVSGEDILYVEGYATANNKVMVFLHQNGKLIKQWETTSDGQGNWSLKERILLRSGISKISARTKNEKGAISNPSEECVFQAVLEGIVIGPLIITFQTINLILIVLLIIVFVMVVLLSIRIRRIRRTIKEETKDLKDKFYKEYNELKVDIEKQLSLLEEIRKKKGLSEKERKMEKELLDNFADIERTLIKELGDVEKIR